MSNNYSLFTLVQSLTAKEKTFIKSRSKKGSSYLNLFNEVIAQKVYDEKELIKKLGGKTNKNSL